MREKVLIVDDNEANLCLLDCLLRGHGAEVVSAKNGQEALDKARLDPPDMIISDILMPVMDGYTLCRHCKADARLRRIPFVFYTATYTDSQDEAFALSLGAERFVIKPQAPDILMSILKEVLEKPPAAGPASLMPLGEDMEFFRRHNEALFRKLEKKMVDLEIANQKLKLLEEHYRLSFEHVADVIYLLDTEPRFTGISPSVERILGYKPQEFIGWPVDKLGSIIAPESLGQALEDVARVLKGEMVSERIYRFVARDGTIKIGEVNASPLMRDGRIIGLVSVARDVTDRKQAEDKLKLTLENLHKAVLATIRVMAFAVEARDPYTSGHQFRVAALAHAIAGEMNRPQEQMESIRLAASIHDIGKLSIPAEILSKPTKLTDIEFSLIKEHSQKGFDILKGVPSPWPLAEIVYQHHERVDGSGYPRHLKGDGIMLEARILGVADAVEAMASHRPYRPGLGIEAALKEIKAKRGILFDAEVVDACVRLFREKNYRLPEA
ncbi:MAG: HD domain-containing phosphohydrolase [Acidobacteriota bacterium]